MIIVLLFGNNKNDAFENFHSNTRTPDLRFKTYFNRSFYICIRKIFFFFTAHARGINSSAGDGQTLPAMHGHRAKTPVRIFRLLRTYVRVINTNHVSHGAF